MLTEIFQFLRGDIGFIDIVVHIGAIAFVVFCATPLHEYAHALIATKLGDETPNQAGRLTIDPKAHIDPIGAALIFLVGFGYAKPVPVRMRNFNNPKRDMALVALAGPVCNLIQAFICMLLYYVSIMLSSKSGAMVLQYMGAFFIFAASININLAVFNLLPIPPLDGSRLATALLPSKYYFKIMQYERYIQIALFVLLFTGILTKPLSLLSSIVFSGIAFVTGLPFALIS